MSDLDDLLEQNRALKEHVTALERVVLSRTDPLQRALFEHASGLVMIVSPEGRLLHFRDGSSAFGDVVGRSLFEFVEPRSQEIIRQALEQVRATRAMTKYEVVGRGQDGSYGRSYLTHAVPVLDGGELSSILLVSVDITERVQLERSLEESRRTLQLALDATKMGLWKWDLVTDMLEWDARALELYGVTESPMTAAACVSRIHPDDRDRVEEALGRAVAKGVFTPMEYRIASPPGEPERWILAMGTVLKDDRGTPTGMVGGAIDVTEQRNVATRLQRAERVEALGQLTAGIAHNFNNLLAAILPNIELAKRAPPERAQAALSVALEAALQARDLVKSLFALTTRRSVSLEQRCDPRDVLARLHSLCRLTFPREIELAVQIDPGASAVAMSASDLEQVLLNILFNARDALTHVTGRPRRIAATVEPVLSSGGTAFVRISVSDTGTGMPEPVRLRIFEPFFTTKPAQRGSGLGLSSAFTRIREAGGTIDCTSAVGVGTTFSIMIPAALPALRLADAATDHDSASVAHETILVVDDEPLVRDIVAELLRIEGYAVLEAPSAGDARELLREHGSSIGLVLLDQSMPVESGLEALPSLRALSPAPVVLFTGISIPPPPHVAAVLAKPARSEELYRVVREVLDRAAE